MTTNALHLEIIALAEADDDGALSFPKDALAHLRHRFLELLKSESFAPYVAEFVRAVAAFQAGGQGAAAVQLMDLGNEVVEELSALHAAPAEKLKVAVTGAENLSTMRPVGTGPAPIGARKATDFIRPLPKRRG